MLVQIEKAPSALSIWVVQLQVSLAGVGGRSPSEDDVEPILELMNRTRGVRDVAVVPLEGGMAVAVSLVAADATTALHRARHLTISCARYAGLGDAVVARTTIVRAHRAATA